MRAFREARSDREGAQGPEGSGRIAFGPRKPAGLLETGGEGRRLPVRCAPVAAEVSEGHVASVGREACAALPLRKRARGRSRRDGAPPREAGIVRTAPRRPSARRRCRRGPVRAGAHSRRSRPFEASGGQAGKEGRPYLRRPKIGKGGPVVFQVRRGSALQRHLPDPETGGAKRAGRILCHRRMGFLAGIAGQGPRRLQFRRAPDNPARRPAGSRAGWATGGPGRKIRGDSGTSPKGRDRR